MMHRPTDIIAARFALALAALRGAVCPKGTA